MISNIKRYNSTINTIISIIRGNKYHNKYGGYLYFDNSLYMSSVYIALVYDVNHFIVDEDKNGDVFIGIDLNKVQIDLGQVDKSVRDTVHNTVLYHVHQDKLFYDDLMRDISPYDIDSISPQNADKTEYYNKLYQAVYNLSDYANIDSFLGEKEFPTLKNRKLLPVVVLKLSKGKISFTDTCYPKSSKSNRYTYNISDLNDKNRVRNLREYSRVPLGLISTKITGNHIIRYSG